MTSNNNLQLITKPAKYDIRSRPEHSFADDVVKASEEMTRVVISRMWQSSIVRAMYGGEGKRWNK